jgi:hypothetical protein
MYKACGNWQRSSRFQCSPILSILRKGSYGYAIIQRVRDLSGGKIE